MNNIFEVIETLEACEKILEERSDDDRSLWAIIAAIRACREWLDKNAEDMLEK